MAEQRQYLDKEGLDRLIENIKESYQRKGDYASTSDLDNYQPKGDYLTSTSDIEATKLKKPVYIWGQKFDGSADIDGMLSLYATLKLGNEKTTRQIQSYVADDGEFRVRLLGNSGNILNSISITSTQTTIGFGSGMEAVVISDNSKDRLRVNGTITATDNIVAPNINELDSAVADIASDIAEIEAAQASDLAKITELQGKLNGIGNVQDFVNSSIATSTAEFKGTYNSLSELQDVSADANDYGFVVSTDSEGNTVYNRYKYVENEGWLFEYALNNSSFTAAQWAAIQSGITSTHVAKIDLLKGLYVSNVSNSGGSITITQKSYYDGVESSKTIDFKTLNGQSLFGQGDIKVDAYSKTDADNKFATKNDLDVVETLAESVNRGLGEANQEIQRLNDEKAEKSELDEYATKQYADDAAADILNSSPEQLQVINAIRERLEDDEDLANALTEQIAEAPKRAFIDMWNKLAIITVSSVNYTFGKYNEATGFFELNGIVDITYPEAIQILMRSEHKELYSAENLYAINGAYTNEKDMQCRTYFPIKVSSFSPLLKSVLKDNVYVESISVVSNYAHSIRFSADTNSFSGAKRLKRVFLSSPNSAKTSSIYEAHFKGCTALERIEKLGEFRDNWPCTLDISDSPNFDLSCFDTALKKKANNATVKLHPDVYAKLTPDMLEQAATNNITFATP